MNNFQTLSISGRVAQWITRLTTDQEIPGSNPGMLEFFLQSGMIICFCFYSQDAASDRNIYFETKKLKPVIRK